MDNKVAHIRLINWNDIRPTLPTVEPWDERIDDAIDIYICALGFEHRAGAISQSIALGLAGVDIPRSALGVICTYTTNQEDNEQNRSLLRTALASFCATQIDANGDSPEELDGLLSKQLVARIQPGKRVSVVFDISVSSGNLIVSVMHTLLRYSKYVSLKILYAEPERYFPIRDEFESDPQQFVLKACAPGDSNSPQEYGVDEVEINELYPGLDGDSRPEFVIAVPSFRTARLVRCLQQISDQPLSAPDKHVYWILGEPPASDLKWRLEFQKRVINTTLSEMVGFSPEDTLAPKLQPENCATCSTRDYRDILQRVVEEADRRLGYNLSVVHMGSKLQAIGISLALYARTEIAVWYARPTNYNARRYSEGVGAKWVLDIPDLCGLAGKITSVGKLSFTPNIEADTADMPSI